MKGLSMKGSAIAASLAVVMALGAVPLWAQAAGQGRPAQPTQTKPAQPPGATQPAPSSPQPAGQAPATPPPAAAPAPQPPAPFPAGAKIAFVNPQRIFQESAEGKAALTRVNALTQRKQTENQQRQKTLQDNQQKLQTSGTLLSDAARSALEKEIEKQQVDLQRFQQDAQAEIQELQNEVQREFAAKFQPVIDQVAREKGLHMVFNMVDSGLAWAEPGLDISNEVIKKLESPKPAAPPKQ
jgi:outer membrane protein